MTKTSNWIIKQIRCVLASLPGKCLLCRRVCHEVSNLCSDCNKQLPYLNKICHGCALPFYGPEDRCAGCQLRRPLIDFCFSVLSYQDPVDRLVTGLKFSGRLEHGLLLSHLLLQAVADNYDKDEFPDLILPVPLHRRRWRERGFNQAEEIGVAVARRLGIPVSRTLVSRHKATQAQSELFSIAARRKNLAGAFTCCNPDAVQGKHVMIVDDVITTMATMNALASCLRKNGARRIDAWSIARALR